MPTGKMVVYTESALASVSQDVCRRKTIAAGLPLRSPSTAAKRVVHDQCVIPRARSTSGNKGPCLLLIKFN